MSELQKCRTSRAQIRRQQRKASRDDLLTLLLEDVLQQQREKGERLAATSATPLQQLRSFAHGHVSVIVNRPAGRMIVSHLELLASHQKSTELLQKQDEYVREIIFQGWQR